MSFFGPRHVPGSFIGSFYAAFLALILLLILSPASASDKVVKWSNLTSEDGLSQNSVHSILQDSDGFMWFGTRFGLSRYDGIEFRSFLYDPLDTNSLPGYRIAALAEDLNGLIWIGTTLGGLSRFDKHSETFTNFQANPLDSTSLVSNYITCLFVDSRGDIWVGTEEGLCRYRQDESIFETIHLKMSDGSTQYRISSISEIPSGTMWIGTEDGALLKTGIDSLEQETILPSVPQSSLNINTMLADPDRHVLWASRIGEGFFKIDLNDGSIKVFGDYYTHRILQFMGVFSLGFRDDGMIWIATGSGVVRFDPETESYDIFQHNPADPSSISDDMVYAILVDHHGGIWAGSESGGVDYHDPELLRINHGQRDDATSNSIKADMVFSVAEDNDQNIWFGTLNGGTSVLDPGIGSFTHFGSNDYDVNVHWTRNMISRVLPVGAQEVWLGTFNTGLYRLNPTNGNYDHFKNVDDDSTSFSDKTVRDLLQTRDGTLWVATETQGISKFHSTTQSFSHYRHDPENPNSISSNFPYCLLEDHTGKIWIGTSDAGLSCFDPVNETFSHYRVSPSIGPSISSNCVLTLYEDSDNTLWIGTRSGGLNRLDSNRVSISAVDLQSHPSELTIFGILQDDHGFLWLSSNQGILKAHPDSGLVNRYNSSDGTQSEFYFRSSVRASNGTMYFGGIDGYNYFHPDSIKDNVQIPPVYLTGLMVNHEEVRIGENGNGEVLLDKAITYTNKLVLKHKHKVVRFKFAALSYSASHKNRYTYKLEGYDEDWIYSDSEIHAQYMNLPAGGYTFRVKGSNNDGVWNEDGLSLAVTVLPPFWRTLWFRTAMSLFLLALTVLYIRLRTAKIKAEQVKLERLVRERTEQLRKEMEERQRLEIEQSQLKTDHLKRELLTQSLHLNDKQQIMEDLHNELEVVCEQKPDEARSRLKKLQRFLKDKISVKEGWEEFEHWFRQVHTGFYSTLRENFPELSESELKVCALLRLKMSSKDIARVMNVQPPSVDIYRHRIRKKMDLQGDENLASFLGQF